MHKYAVYAFLIVALMGCGGANPTSINQQSMTKALNASSFQGKWDSGSAKIDFSNASQDYFLGTISAENIVCQFSMRIYLNDQSATLTVGGASPISYPMPSCTGTCGTDYQCQSQCAAQENAASADATTFCASYNNSYSLQIQNDSLEMCILNSSTDCASFAKAIQ